MAPPSSAEEAAPRDRAWSSDSAGSTASVGSIGAEITAAVAGLEEDHDGVDTVRVRAGLAACAAFRRTVHSGEPRPPRRLVLQQRSQAGGAPAVAMGSDELVLVDTVDEVSGAVVCRLRAFVQDAVMYVEAPAQLHTPLRAALLLLLDMAETLACCTAYLFVEKRTATDACLRAWQYCGFDRVAATHPSYHTLRQVLCGPPPQ